MRSKKSASQKLTVVLLAVILVLCCTIGGTLAFLSAESGTVTNTFTVGKIEIELKEHELQADGTLGTEEVTENTTYKIVPGAKQPKDPFVTVKSGSEKCYVYVCIENQLGANLTYNIGNEWAEVGKSGDKVVYRYNTEIDASAADVTKTIFTEVTYSGDITEKTIGALAGQKVIINAFAHQSENTDEATADAAACDKFSVTAVTPNP